MCPNACKDAVHNPNVRSIRRNIRTNLREEHDQRNLPQHRRLTSGIRTRDDVHGLLGIENRVIRDKPLDPPGELFDNRMASCHNGNDIAIIHHRTAPAVIDRKLCESRCDIELGNNPCPIKNTSRPVPRNHFAQLDKELTLKGDLAVLSPHHLRFHFLELRCEVAFASCCGLLADVIFRDEF